MKTQIKDSWIIEHINKPKDLYREYKSYYNKILNINKIFYWHRIANIPMHTETESILKGKVDNYLTQMSFIYAAAKDCEVRSKNVRSTHWIVRYIPLGCWEKSVYISNFQSKKDFLVLCKKKREPVTMAPLPPAPAPAKAFSVMNYIQKIKSLLN